MFDWFKKKDKVYWNREKICSSCGSTTDLIREGDDAFHGMGWWTCKLCRKYFDILYEEECKKENQELIKRRKDWIKQRDKVLKYV